MSNRYWSKWGDPGEEGQTVGFNGRTRYYVQSEGECVYIHTSEIDDLIYQLMRLKRKVEGE